MLAVTRKPSSASFEQRVLNYIPALSLRHVLVEPQRLPDGIAAQRRFFARMEGYDLVWWHRHLLHPIWLGHLRRHAKRVVFEFDDPVTHSGTGEGRPSLSRRIRFALLLRRCDAAIAASDYLASMARPYCREVHVLPMGIDVPMTVPQVCQRPGPRQLLWIGSRATQPYLSIIASPLSQLGRRRSDVVLRLVAHEPADFPPLRVVYRRWSPQEQEAALRECHVGLCPMPDTVWTRGKCPYKVIQYMANGMPWVGSAVGENLPAAGEGRRGLCAASASQWFEALDRLVTEAPTRQAMGEQGRVYVAEHHNRQELIDRLSNLLRRSGQPGEP